MSPFDSVLGLAQRFVGRVADARRRRADYRTLQGLPDRLLRDVGFTRDILGRVEQLPGDFR